MNNRDEAREFLAGGGGPKSAFTKYDRPGTTKGGTIVGWRRRQQSDMKTGELKTWRNGDPMMQLEITVQTAERDPQVPDDDGQRRFFVKGQMTKAVQAAIQAAGVDTIEEGGELYVQYSGDGPSAGPGLDGPKLYAASYVRAPIGFGTTDPNAGLVMQHPVQMAAPTQMQTMAAPVQMQMAAPVQQTLPAPASEQQMVTQAAAQGQAIMDAATQVAAAGLGGVVMGSPQPAAGAPSGAGVGSVAGTPSGPPSSVEAAMAALSPEERAQMGLPPA